MKEIINTLIGFIEYLNNTEVEDMSFVDCLDVFKNIYKKNKKIYLHINLFMLICKVPYRFSKGAVA